ncbi:MAG: helix-turn-helix transcriptional regulator, partial [Sandarakinorhabdus sp.]|nr:helix-turn-helix transcriptional regulator [Sandarakinorhabdus sp.]
MRCNNARTGAHPVHRRRARSRCGYPCSAACRMREKPMATHFSDGLSLVLKALSISRAQLASAIDVDKSLVSRWCSGRITPSETNLARLTHHIAGYLPGFKMLDWDAPLEQLAARFGVEYGPLQRGRPGLSDWVQAPILREAAANVLAHGASYEGFWRTTRPSSEAPGQFIHEHVLLRVTPDGMLSFRLAIMDIRYAGWSMPLQNKLFSIATDETTGTFVFGIFDGVMRQPAELVDGLIMTVMRDAAGTPIASKCLLE